MFDNLFRLAGPNGTASMLLAVALAVIGVVLVGSLARDGARLWANVLALVVAHRRRCVLLGRL
jgi:hypothetical protein